MVHSKACFVSSFPSPSARVCACHTASQLDEALDKYTRVTTMLAKMHFNVGTIKMSQGKHADAIEAFSQVMIPLLSTSNICVLLLGS